MKRKKQVSTKMTTKSTTPERERANKKTITKINI